MLPEQSSNNEPFSEKPKRQQVEYVGAPTEFADEAEVPEAISLIARIVAGGAISSAYISGIVILTGVACAVCALFYVITSTLLQ